MHFRMASPSSLDWSLVQAFLAVAEMGSLSAAARALGASQPTIGRQIKAMEEQLGAELFHRRGHGLDLTETGAALLERARAMRKAAHDIELLTASVAGQLEGTVRITASVAVSVHHLPKLVAHVRELEPRVDIEVVPSDETTNLHFREADIAIRMYRPTQLDLVTTHVGDIAFGAYAARSYVERRGIPRTTEELLLHDVIGMDKSPVLIEGFRDAGVVVERGAFPVRTDDPIVQWALLKAGAGIGFAQKVVAREQPNLVELPLELDLPVLPVWLTAHEAVRSAVRVARVWELLAEGLREICSDG